MARFASRYSISPFLGAAKFRCGAFYGLLRCRKTPLWRQSPASLTPRSMNSTPPADNAPRMAASVFRCGCASPFSSLQIVRRWTRLRLASSVDVHCSMARAPRN